jgi:hypothetical protein
MEEILKKQAINQTKTDLSTNKPTNTRNIGYDLYEIKTLKYNMRLNFLLD